MSTILIKNVLLNNNTTDVLIENNLISKIAPNQTIIADKTIDGSNKAILPPFYNMHCHAPMTLERGMADDLELFTWLSQHIWPAEGRLNHELVYDGTRLAILEMIKTGTVFFNDSYLFPTATIKAVEEMGVRAAIGILYINALDEKLLDKEEMWAKVNSHSNRIIITLAPHAIYTTTPEILSEIAKLSQKHDMFIHIHLSETAKEVSDCIETHGVTPVEYLQKLNILGPKTILAHCVHLNDNDRKIIAETKSIISHQPISNMKLVSGQFEFTKAIESGCIVTIGTDGCASNNNLSMIDEMKFSALSAKIKENNPEAAPAEAVFKLATEAGAKAFGINAGVIAEGYLADIMLVDLTKTFTTGGKNIYSHMVYSADSSCIDTVICDGKILMENRYVENEEEIIKKGKIACDYIQNISNNN